MHQRLHISVIIGSTRPNRFSEKPAAWIFDHVQKLENVEAELLDLRDWPLPFFDQPISPSMVEGSYGNALVDSWAKKIQEADAFIWVSPEYNHSTSAVLKNALDSVYKEWHKKPVAFVSYGSVGGARSVEHLRQIAVELQMAPLRNAVHIPGDIVFPVLAGKAQWDPENAPSLVRSADTMLKDLVWWAHALKHAREPQADIL